MFASIVGVVVAAGLIGITYIKLWKFNYWGRKGLPALNPPFPLGHGSNLLLQKNSFAYEFKSIYDQIKGNGNRHGGIYILTQPIYIPIEKSITETILANDCDKFKEFMFCKNMNKEISLNLSHISFMKMSSFTECIQSGTNVNIRNVLNEIETKFICKNFFDGKSKRVDDVIQSVRKRYMHGTFKVIFSLCSEFILNYYEKKHVNQSHLSLLTREMKNILSDPNTSTIIHELANDLDINDKNKLRELTEYIFECIKCLDIVFNIVLPFCIYEISCNVHIQDMLRKEIKLHLEASNGEITFDLLTEMKYLDQVIKETLRKYPPCPVVIRKCIKPIVIPWSVISLESGINTIISTMGIHYDKEIYSDPESFDPGRFDLFKETENYTYLPFGSNTLTAEQEFSIFQAKIIICSLLENYKLSTNDDGCNVNICAKNLHLIPDGELCINIEPIK